MLPGAYEEAISFFSEYINRYPQDSDAYQGRAAALWYAGKLQDAIQEYSHALELKPNDILSLCGRGQVLAEIGEGRKALDDLNLALEAIKEAPEAGPIWEEWYRQIEAFVRNGRVVALAGLGEQS